MGGLRPIEKQCKFHEHTHEKTCLHGILFKKKLTKVRNTNTKTNYKICDNEHAYNIINHLFKFQITCSKQQRFVEGRTYIGMVYVMKDMLLGIPYRKSINHKEEISWNHSIKSWCSNIVVCIIEISKRDSYLIHLIVIMTSIDIQFAKYAITYNMCGNQSCGNM